MKRTQTVLAVLLIGIATVNSQDLEKGLLWKISGDEIETASYLYGTFHLLCPDDLVFSDATKEAIQNSEQVVLELDFDDPGLMTTLQQGMMMPEGMTARDYLDSAQYKLVSEFFTAKMGMPFQMIHGIKPFFLSSMTILFFLDCQPGSPEMEFAKLAAEQGIEVIGLETAEEQLGFVDNISLDDAAEMLLLSIEDVDDADQMTSDMISTYLEGDLEGIQDIIDEYMDEEYSEMNDGLIISRNLDWVPKVKEMISEKASFIAVGAGHLSGEEGLIRLLRKEGYTVEALK